MVRCQYQYGQRARPVQWVLPTCDTDNVLELPAAGVSRLPAGWSGPHGAAAGAADHQNYDLGTEVVVLSVLRQDEHGRCLEAACAGSASWRRW
jgi:hypothetical protein